MADVAFVIGIGFEEFMLTARKMVLNQSCIDSSVRRCVLINVNYLPHTWKIKYILVAGVCLFRTRLNGILQIEYEVYPQLELSCRLDG